MGDIRNPLSEPAFGLEANNILRNTVITSTGGQPEDDVIPPATNMSTPSVAASMNEIKLTARQREIYEFYSQAKANIFGADEYSMIAPDPKRSLFLSDETICIAKALFGLKFDLGVRKFAVKHALTTLLLQMICLPIGLWVITTNAPHWIYFITLLGGAFPILLILRSHFQIARQLCFQWEPVFLTFYSLIFCIGIAILRSGDFSVVFIFGAMFPTLLASAFADASALRLDCAFIKGDISLLFLALPPYIASICCVVVNVIFVTFGQWDTSQAYYPAETRSVVQSTGSTITLFLLRSLVLLIIEPRRCVSLHAPMMNSIVTLAPDASRSTEVLPEGYRNYYVSCVLSAKLTRLNEPEDLYDLTDSERRAQSVLEQQRQQRQYQRQQRETTISNPSLSSRGNRFAGSPSLVDHRGRNRGITVDVSANHSITTTLVPEI